MKRDYEKKLIEVSRKIWDYAELRFQEKKSSAALSDLLEEEGFSVTRGLAGMDTAFQAVIGTGHPVIGILAEYDALSGLSQEAGVLEPVARAGIESGHGCGHNLLGTGAVGAALLLRDYLEESGNLGTVVLLGCPAEEGGAGKTYMARAGVFDGLDLALTWHPAGGYAVMTGSMQANCQAYFRFKGKSAHAAAAPFLGRSALDAVELMDVGVNYMREHIEPTDRIHYAVLDTGGSSPNVVQNHAEVLYLIRSTDNEKVKALYERVCKVAQGAALMTETELEICFDKACSNTISNSVLENVLYQSMLRIPLPHYTEEELCFARRIRDTYQSLSMENDLALSFLPNVKRRVYAGKLAEMEVAQFVVPHEHLDVYIAGSSDVGDCSHVVPTAQFVAGTATPGTPGHSWQMVSQGRCSTAEKGMIYAAEVLADAVKTIFENPELAVQAKAEFLAVTEGKPYVCPIPADIKPHQQMRE